jgi:hypothetical protein
MATNTRRIFVLLDVRERQNTGYWTVESDMWLEPGPTNFATGVVVTPQIGYFGGGDTV